MFVRVLGLGLFFSRKSTPFFRPPKEVYIYMPLKVVFRSIFFPGLFGPYGSVVDASIRLWETWCGKSKYGLKKVVRAEVGVVIARAAAMKEEE